MGPFWTSLFEHLKHCGRSATLFILTLAALCILIFLAAILYAAHLHKYLLPALPVIVVLSVAWVGVFVRRARVRRREGLLRSPMSDDELRAARSKLLTPRR